MHTRTARRDSRAGKDNSFGFGRLGQDVRHDTEDMRPAAVGGRPDIGARRNIHKKGSRADKGQAAQDADRPPCRCGRRGAGKHKAAAFADTLGGHIDHTLVLRAAHTHALLRGGRRPFVRDSRGRSKTRRAEGAGDGRAVRQAVRRRGRRPDIRAGQAAPQAHRRRRTQTDSRSA